MLGQHINSTCMQEAQARMSVSFEFTPADIRAFHRHARGVMPEYRRIKWIFGFIAAFIAIQSAFSSQSSQSLFVKALTALIIFGFIWLMFIALSRLIGYLSMTIFPNRKGLSGVICERTISIDPEGLTETTPVNQGRHSWRGIYLVAATSDHIFIYIQPNQAHAIPRRSFSSRDQFDLFLRLASDYHRASTQSAICR